MANCTTPIKNGIKILRCHPCCHKLCYRNLHRSQACTAGKLDKSTSNKKRHFPFQNYTHWFNLDYGGSNPFNLLGMYFKEFWQRTFNLLWGLYRWTSSQPFSVLPSKWSSGKLVSWRIYISALLIHARLWENLTFRKCRMPGMLLMQDCSFSICIRNLQGNQRSIMYVTIDCHS